MTKVWKRRDLLKLGLGGWLLSQVPLAGASTAPVRKSTRPRYLFLICLHGGFDPIYTTDPKIRADVEPWVDLPYGPESIIDTGSVQLGPHMGALRPWAPKLAILNGVHIRTANHDAGSWQVQRLKTGVEQQMPTLLHILGRHREGQPIGAMQLGLLNCNDYNPGWFGGLERDLDETAPADFERVARALRLQAQKLRDRGGGPEVQVSAENVEQGSALMERLPQVPRFVQETWAPKEMDPDGVGNNFQRALWLFQNDLTSSVYYRVGRTDLRWDTHYNNAERQTKLNSCFFPLLARLFSELEQRRNAHGTLASNSLVIVMSDMGRLPRINPMMGKDHFPEIPLLFFGRGINTRDGKGATYGQTARRMEALPVSLKTGRAAKGGHSLILDDVGTTLLHMAGLDPSLYGYFGQVLEFLEAA